MVLSQLYLNAMKWTSLLQEVQVIGTPGSVNPDIQGVAYDSRMVRENYLFAALAGSKQQGSRFVNEALQRGAVALVAEVPMAHPAHVAFAQVADARRALADISCAFYEHPSKYLQTIGVTGTNGKTTASFLTKAIMAAAGRAPGLLGTVQYEIGQRRIPSTRTTPESADLQALLRQMLVAGCRSAVMEVSSHALAQKRVWGIDFDVAVFTNLTEEHLDYHRDMQGYFAAKSALFCGLGHREKKSVAVINLDDDWGRKLLGGGHPRVQEITYGLDSHAQVRAENLQLTSMGSSFLLQTPWGAAEVRLPLLGRYNVSNALASCAACGSLGIDPALMAEVLGRMPSVPGRLEAVANRRGIHVFVDYAHTADALKNVLTALRECADQRIILVFGCGGDRDRSKRAPMGSVASRMADYSIVTTDNARSEDPADIAGEVLAGFGSDRQVDMILDRSEAIARAIGLAERGDIVLIAGKGHETYQEIGHTVRPFDDREVARTVLGEEA